MTDSSLDLQESGWEELRREARKIEGDLDVKLSSYAKLGARFTQGGSFFFVSALIVLCACILRFPRLLCCCYLYSLNVGLIVCNVVSDRGFQLDMISSSD